MGTELIRESVAWRTSGCHPMGEADLRWRQRFENLQRVLGQLDAACEALARAPNDAVISMAVVKAYEFSFELSWKTRKDLLAYEGIDAARPREVLREAFSYGLLQNDQLWIDMLEQRNLMIHTYDEERARRALKLITESFQPAIHQLCDQLGRLWKTPPPCATMAL